MSNEEQEYKTIKIGTNDVINYAGKLGINISPNDANSCLSSTKKVVDNGVDPLKLKKFLRDKLCKMKGIENDNSIDDDEMLKKLYSK